MVRWYPLPLHPQSAWISLKEATHTTRFLEGVNWNWNTLGFLHISNVWAAYSADTEQHVQQEKVKMEKERMAFWSWSFQIIPEDFSVVVYTVLACFVIRWVNQSSQILNSLKKYWLVELCQLGKKWPIDFSLSVTKGNVLSVKGRIDGLSCWLWRSKGWRKNTATGQRKTILAEEPMNCQWHQMFCFVCFDTLSEVHWPPLQPYSPHNHKNVLMVLTHLLLQIQF